MEDSTIETTFADVLAARQHVYRHLQRTPLHHYGALSELIGARVYIKHENHHAVGAFKVRGGVNLAAHLNEFERKAGLYTASTGNHGQSIAFAGKVTGTNVCVAVPEGANTSKVAAMQRLGAHVVTHGRDFDEAREWMHDQAESAGARFIGPTDPQLIAGVGTYTLEIMEDLPETDVIVVPVGAGSGAASACLVAKTVKPSVQVIAVQAQKAPAVYRSWKEGRPMSASMETSAEGLATRVAHDNSLKMLRHQQIGLDDFLLVSDDAMEEAVRLLLTHTKNVAELAGAASLAAALMLGSRIQGKNVVLVLTGGNITMERLHSIIGQNT